MWLFDLFKKKATLSIILEKDSFSCFEKIKWKIVIVPSEDFVSNKLSIWISICNAEFDYILNEYLEDFDTNFTKIIIPSKQYFKWVEVSEEFEFLIPEFEQIAPDDWPNFIYDINHLEKKMTNSNEERKIHYYHIFANFDIPWLDLREKKEIKLN